jgi:hypothetical protein
MGLICAFLAARISAFFGRADKVYHSGLSLELAAKVAFDFFISRGFWHYHSLRKASFFRIFPYFFKRI